MTRATYYKWLHRRLPANEQENRLAAERIEEIHRAYPDKGYRRIRDDMERYYGMHLNDKRVLRICREENIKSTIKYRSHGCTRRASTPQFIAENILGRDFMVEAIMKNGLQMLPNLSIILEMKFIKYIWALSLICMTEELSLS